MLLTIAAKVAGGAVPALISLIMLLPSLAVGARRLHDTDRSGWLLLLYLIPLLGWIVLLVWASQEGKEPNRYSVA